MGSSCAKSYDDPTRHPKFRAQDLHAPLFRKHISESVDHKANRKYCSPELIEKVAEEFKVVDTDGSGDISFEEFRASHLGKNLSEDEARKHFSAIDQNKNKKIELQEFNEYQLNEESEESTADIKLTN